MLVGSEPDMPELQSANALGHSMNERNTRQNATCDMQSHEGRRWLQIGRMGAKVGDNRTG